MFNVERLRELRKKRGLTQNELAKLLDVGRTTVTLWEKGVNNPRIEVLPKLARVLHCSVDDLLRHKT